MTENFESEKKDALDLIPSRIKYYLLDWKDKNMSNYIEKYEGLRLRDLTIKQLYELFVYATEKDKVKLKKI